ncbi:MAG: hypothetical protein IBX60_01680 [Candidatus Aminicenantes bacterium]|nr:hypothetical protein [Candidatus Aminicenantes bacterium]
MKKAKLTLTITIILPFVLFLLSCNPIENESQSSSLLIVESLTGTDIEGNEVNLLQSDVLKVDSSTGNTYITADIAKAILSAKLLQPDSPVGPSHYNNIMVTRYFVSYSRSDGKNKEGVDVPYSFEGSLSTLVEIDSSTNVSFVIVREVAKAEPPLVNLTEGRGEGVLQVTAKVEFYGHDMTNHNVKATGYLTIFFGNYIDE